MMGCTVYPILHKRSNIRTIILLIASLLCRYDHLVATQTSSQLGAASSSQKVSLKTLTPTERDRLALAIDRDLTMPEADRKAIQKALAAVAQQLSTKDLTALSTTSTVPTEVTIPPELLKQIKDKKVSASLLTVPGFGKAQLMPISNELNREAGFNLKFTKEGKTTLDVNTMALDGAKFDIIEDKLTANGTVTIMGKRAKIGVKKISLGSSPFVIGTIILQLSFGQDVQEKDKYTGENITEFKYDPLVITLPNGKEITIKYAYLTIGGDEGAPMVLSSEITIFGQKAIFSILFDLSAITAKLEVKNLPLVALAPELKRTILNNWQLKKASLMIDLWRASYGRPEVAKVKYGRRMTCTGTIAKRPLEMPPLEPTDYATEEMQSMENAFSTEPAPDASASVIPDGGSVDPLVEGSEASINPELLANELPEPAPVDEEGDHSLEFSTELPPEDVDIPFAVEPEGGNLPEISEAEWMKPEEEPVPEPNTEFSVKIVLSQAGIRLSIRAQELPINKIGVVDSAEISFIAERSRTARNDIRQFYPKTDKKTLNQLAATLEITGDTLPIKNIGTLKSISFMIGFTKQEREKPSDPEVIYKNLHGKISIGGVLSLDIDGIGNPLIDVEATYTHEGLFFKGSIDMNLSYKAIELQQLKVIYGHAVLDVEGEKSKQQEELRREISQQAKRESWRQKQDTLRESENAVLPQKSTDTFKKGPKPLARDKSLSLIGTVKLFGITFLARAIILIDAKTKKRTATFSFTALIGSVRPFKKTGIKGLEDCGLNDVIASIVANPKTKMPTVILSGKAAFGNVAFPANLMLAFSKDSKKPCIVVFSDAIADKKLSDMIPGLPSSVDVTCRAAHLLMSSCKIDTTYFLLPDNVQKLLPQLIPKGLSINADIPLDGSLGAVGKFLGMVPDHAFKCKGAVSFDKILPEYSFGIAITSKEIEEAVDPTKRKALLSTKVTAEYKDMQAMQAMEASIPPMEDIDYDDNGNPLPPHPKPKFSLDSISIVIKNGVILGGAPSIGVEAVVLVRPTPEELLSFKGVLDFTGITVDFGAQMLGTWNNPFGLQGWKLTDVGLIAGFFATPPPIPVKLGGAAQLKVNNDLDIAFKIMADVTTMNFAIEGRANKIFTIVDIFNLFVKALKLNIPEVKLPVEISNFGIKFARQQVKILDQVIDPGFGLKGDIKIFDKKGSFEGRIDGSGVKFLGTLEKTVIPNLFYLTDAKETGDPIIDLELSLQRQKCLVSGMIGFGPGPFIKQKTFIEVSDKGMKADFEAAIGDAVFDGKPLLGTHVVFEAGGSFTDPQAQLTVTFQQNLQKFIRKAILDNVDEAKQKVIAGITQAQSDLKVLDQAQQFSSQSISQIVQNIENIKQVAKKFDDAEAEVISKLRVLQDAVSDIDKKIEEKKRWYYSLPKV